MTGHPGGPFEAQRAGHEAGHAHRGSAARRTVAVIPAGVGLDTALAVLTGLGSCYPPAALALGHDPAGGLRVLYDPDLEGRDADAAPAGETPSPSVEIGLGAGEPQDLLRFAFSADDQQDGVRALALFLIGLLGDAGAANFLTYTVEPPGLGRYALTIQHCAGPTPAELIAALQDQLAAATGPAAPPAGPGRTPA